MRRHLLIVALLSSCGEAQPGMVGDAAQSVDAADASKPDAGGHAHDGAPAVGAACDPRLASSCATGEKCASTRWDLAQPWPTPRCVPDLAAMGQGEDGVCFAAPGVADGCGTGLSCTNFGSGEGYCRRTCARGEACREGDVCVTVDAASSFALCLTSCTDDASCGAAGWLVCVERAGQRYCESARADAR